MIRVLSSQKAIKKRTEIHSHLWKKEKKKIAKSSIDSG